MRQVVAHNDVILLAGKKLGLRQHFISFNRWAARMGALEWTLERAAAVSDILVRFTKLSSHSRFHALFQEPRRLRLRIKM
jgi:hypothetical protein